MKTRVWCESGFQFQQHDERERNTSWIQFPLYLHHTQHNSWAHLFESRSKSQQPIYQIWLQALIELNVVLADPYYTILGSPSHHRESIWGAWPQCCRREVDWGTSSFAGASQGTPCPAGPSPGPPPPPPPRPGSPAGRRRCPANTAQVKQFEHLQRSLEIEQVLEVLLIILKYILSKV